MFCIFSKSTWRKWRQPGPSLKRKRKVESDRYRFGYQVTFTLNILIPLVLAVKQRDNKVHQQEVKKHGKEAVNVCVCTVL